MAKILLLSDLHLETEKERAFPSVTIPRDITILAGDIHSGLDATDFILENLEYGDVVYILGNHESYDMPLEEVQKQWKEDQVRSIRTLARMNKSRGRFYFLDNSSAVIRGTVFLGTTLWTDFNKGDPVNMDVAKRRINDYQKIMRSNVDGMDILGLMLRDHATGDNSVSRLFITPKDTLRYHRKAVRWLRGELRKNKGRKTVVVSHHLPSMKSVHSRYLSDDPDSEIMRLNTAFASNLESMILRHKPALWLHGHTHSSCDYNIGETRIVCNPRGYYPYDLNQQFDPHLILEI